MFVNFGANDPVHMFKQFTKDKVMQMLETNREMSYTWNDYVSRETNRYIKQLVIMNLKEDQFMELLFK